LIILFVLVTQGRTPWATIISPLPGLKTYSSYIEARYLQATSTTLIVAAFFVAFRFAFLLEIIRRGMIGEDRFFFG
jgi:hypothetical protein